MRKITKVVIGIVVIVGYVFLNLKMNAVYYAKHMPHKEGTYPELRVLVDNLFWISQLENENFGYDMDGTNSIDKIVNGEQVAFFTHSEVDEKEYHYNDIKNGINYTFDRNFNLIRALQREKIETK